MPLSNLPLVIGIGNRLMGDDAAGPQVISLLEQKRDLAAELAVLDTPGYALLTHIQNRDLVILVDAATFDASRGDYARLTANEVRRRPESGLSLHDADPFSVVDYAEKLGLAPREFVVYAIRFETITPSRALSARVKRTAAVVAEAIAAELAGHA